VGVSLIVLAAVCKHPKLPFHTTEQLLTHHTLLLNECLTELPFQLVYPTVYGTIIYWLVGK
jgi:hypothetical protein